MRTFSLFLSLFTFLFIISTLIWRLSPWFPSFPPPISRIPTLIPCIATPIPRIPTLILYTPTLIPCFPTTILCIPTLIPRIPTLISSISTPISYIPTLITHIPTPIICIPTLVPCIPTSISCIPTLISPIPIIPTLIYCILIIPLIPFLDFPFWLLQIALALHTLEIFCYLILRNHWTWTWKIMDYLIGLRLLFWYIGFGLRKYLNTLLDMMRKCCKKKFYVISKYIFIQSK